ncbi:MAG: serine/threonine-protein phosphatase [Anaerolineae bacterium]|nr:serine/threonine-protein phosphatase [Anaerolineae bacterium]
MTELSTGSPQVSPQIEVWGASDVGRTREGNEDSIFPDSTGQGGFVYNLRPDTVARKGQLLIVADGVGGAQGGRTASQWAIQRAVERYYDLPGGDLGTDLHTAVSFANSSLVDYLQHQHLPDAGCTMTAAVIHGMNLYVANVGDSRTYLIRGGRAYQITKDHTLTQQKIDRGQLRHEDAALDPDKSVLTRSMGATTSVQVDLFRQPLQPGDRVLLCSDGLHDMLSAGEIGRDATNGPPKRATTRLIAEANKRGGFDNISVVLAQVGGSAPVGGGWSTKLLQAWHSLTKQQRSVLLALAVVLGIIVISLLAWVGWSMASNKGKTGDGALTPTVVQATVSPAGEESTPLSSPTPGVVGATTAPTMTPTQETSAATTDPTATLEPTKTPTPAHTPRPRTTATTPPPAGPTTQPSTDSPPQSPTDSPRTQPPPVNPTVPTESPTKEPPPPP